MSQRSVLLLHITSDVEWIDGFASVFCKYNTKTPYGLVKLAVGGSPGFLKMMCIIVVILPSPVGFCGAEGATLARRTSLDTSRSVS